MLIYNKIYSWKVPYRDHLRKEKNYFFRLYRERYHKGLTQNIGHFKLTLISIGYFSQNLTYYCDFLSSICVLFKSSKRPEDISNTERQIKKFRMRKQLYKKELGIFLISNGLLNILCLPQSFSYFKSIHQI